MEENFNNLNNIDILLNLSEKLEISKKFIDNIKKKFKGNNDKLIKKLKKRIQEDYENEIIEQELKKLYPSQKVNIHHYQIFKQRKIKKQNIQNEQNNINYNIANKVKKINKKKLELLKLKVEKSQQKKIKKLDYINFKNYDILNKLNNDDLINILKKLGENDEIFYKTLEEIEDKRIIKKLLIEKIKKYNKKKIYKYYKIVRKNKDQNIIKINKILKKLEKISNDEKDNEKNIKIENGINKIKKLTLEGNYILSYFVKTKQTDLIYTEHQNVRYLNNNNIQFLKEVLLNQNKLYNYSAAYDSLVNITIGSIYYYYNYEIEEKEISEQNKLGIKTGKFFNFINKSPFDLKKYQIYNKNDIKEFIKNIENRKDDKKLLDIEKNCLFYALSKSKNANKINIYELAYFKLNGNVGSNELQKIADNMKIYIAKSYYDKNNKLRTKYYGKDKNNIRFDIALYKNHYFCNDNIEIQQKAAECFEYFTNNERLNEISKTYLDKGILKIDSYSKDFKAKPIQIVKILDEKKMFQYDSDLSKFINYDGDENLYNFENCDGKVLYREIQPKKIDEKEKIILCADFETTTEGEKHIEYMVTIGNLYEEKNQTFISEYYKNGKFKKSCTVFMLDYIKNIKMINKDKQIIVYFHNLKYDMNFLLNYINPRKITKKDGNIYCIKTKDIIFYDSYKVINESIANFNNFFKFEDKNFKKEIMPYNLYTQKTVCNGFNTTVSLNLTLSKLNKKDENEFLKIAKELNCIDKNNFYLLQYAKYYCERDVNILKKGLIKMNEYIKILSNDVLEDENAICLFDYMTISSLANDLFVKAGCFEQVYNISGDHMDFIRKCIDGGTTASHYNKMIKINDNIQDFDACSLYPSAMKRIEGYTKGLPNILKKEQLNYNFLKNVSDYFIKIQIIKVNKPWGISNIYTKENGIKIFHNNNTICHVGKIKFEDLINFQNIEYEILEGLYFNEGFNNKINQIIQKIYDLRKKYKKEGNPVEVIFKLIMNASYGKTILKSSNFTYKCVNKNNKKFDIFQMNNFNRIIEYDEFKKFMLVKINKSIRDHYSCPHVGVNILDMSKRIMNEVQDIIYQNNKIVYYRDTDSLHILEKDVNLIAEKFKQKYNRNLIGNEMGQFHCDFNFNINKETDKYASNVKSIKFLCLGKKFYIDELQAEVTKLNGEIKIEKQYHIRGKGVSKYSIQNKARELKISEMELYEKLYEGEEIEFNLIDDFHPKFTFENNKVKNKFEFKRKIMFNNQKI